MPNSAPIWALVPVKPMALAKSRLAGVLSGSERQALASFMLRRVLHAVRQSGAFDGLLVVSSDQAAGRVALGFGAVTITDERNAGTNAAAMQGLNFLAARQAGTLALHADLPDISPEEIAAAVRALSGGDLVINPDRHDQGTNMLGIPAGATVEPQFGKQSFARHVAEARKVGIEPVVLRQRGISSDVDVPEDLSTPVVSRFLRDLRRGRGVMQRFNSRELVSVGQP
jgi:2-phospho-L-lactate guanylyltransferase